MTLHTGVAGNYYRRIRATTLGQMRPRPIILLLPWALLGIETSLIYLLIRQYGRGLLAQEEVITELKAIRQLLPGNVQAPRPPTGLLVGTPAPDFALRDLKGKVRRLQDFLGEPLLLIFFSPTCGYCQQMAPQLGTIPPDGPHVVIVGHGDREEHQRMAEDYGWRCDVVLESGVNVMNAYQASGTPTGYLLDSDARIASELAIGADQIFALMASDSQGSNISGDSLTADSLRERARRGTERARAAGLAVRDVTESRLKRDGLEAGTAAPDFTLPDLAGNEHSLHEYRGKPVILVFSDPACDPCDVLAPHLVRAEEGRRGDNGKQILMISRGDVEANRRKAREHRFNFPVLLQKNWEVSLEYAMFATPVAYLMDEQGIIINDVAIGPDAIRQLL